MAKQWGGRFSGKTNPAVEKFTESISFDWRLFQEDIFASKIHAEGLKAAKVLTAAELKKIHSGLDAVLKKFKAGQIKFDFSLEDIHTHVEQALKNEIGDLALKLHTGRSRNDQVATDLRLYLKNVTVSQMQQIQMLQTALIDQAEKNIVQVLPGYTHLQPAQPVLLAHHLLAYFEMLQRDRKRFLSAFMSADVMPLGSAALAGTAYEVDREMMAQKLNFQSISQNSMDAVSDRDFVLDYLYAACTLMLHLSRFCEDLIIWNSNEFDFVEIDDAFATGSSIMPQKKNPDVAELTRGKSGLVLGQLMAMMSLLKGLPMTYNRDLQEDKRILFLALDTVTQVLTVFIQMVQTLKFNASQMEQAVQSGYLLATDLADYLVSKKIAFRKAHEIVGQVVQYAISKNKDLSDLALKELQKYSKSIQSDVYEWLKVGNSLAKRQVVGGTSSQQVKRALQNAKKRVKGIV